MLAEFPDWIAEWATANRTRSSVDAKQALTELDKPSQIESARTWLEDEAPEAIEGAGGDNTTYQVATRVRDFGVSKQTCLELLLEHWNETKAVPPWDPEALDQKVRNAYAYATLPAGIADASGELGDVTSELSSLETKTNKPRNKLYYIRFDDAAETALESVAEPLIDDLLDCGTLSVLFGRPKSGKTFNALDLEFHIATGKPWNGLQVKQGLVVHIAAEGGLNIKKRIRALKIHHGIKEDIPLAVVPCPVNLLDATREGDTRKLIELVSQAEAEYGQKAVLIVIDTLSRALAGGDENSSTDMGTFVRHVDKIREEVKSHLMIVHHSGKDQAKGARGWSGLLAALDTEIEVHEGKFTVTNQRDMECLDPVHFRLKTIELGVNSRGKRVTSCVVEVIERAKDEFGSMPKTDLQKELLGYLKRLASKMRQETPKGDIVVRNAKVIEFLNSLTEAVPGSLTDSGKLSKLLNELNGVDGFYKDERNHNVISDLLTAEVSADLASGQR